MKPILKVSLLSCMATLAVSSFGVNSANAAATPQLGDVNVLLPKLHLLNQNEIDSGDLAATKGCDPAVKNYGQMIAKDHRNSDIDVMALIQQQKVDPSKVVWSLEEGAEVTKEKAEFVLLKAIGDCKFDRSFLNNMVQAHQFAIQELKNAAGTATLPATLDLINKSLPVMQSHLDQANNLLKTVQ